MTLPITPRTAMPIGYWLTPVLLDVLAKQRGEPATIFLGTLGLGDISQEAIDDFTHTAHLLSIAAPVQTDQMAQKKLSASLEELLEKASAQDRLHVRTVEAHVCGCGAVEIPVEAVEFLKEKTFKREASGIICKKCEGSTQVKSVEKLFFFFEKKTLSTFFDTTTLSPIFYKKELQNLLTQIAERGIPISKTRNTGFQYQSRNIDIEFLLASASTIFTEPVTLVITNHVQRQALVTALVALELQKGVIRELLVLPYIEHVGQKEKWAIDKMFELGHDKDTIRFMLAHSLSWNKKTCVLEPSVSEVGYRRFTLLKNQIRGSSPSKQISLANFIQSINHEKCTLALKAALSERDFNYSQLFGLL